MHKKKKSKKRTPPRRELGHVFVSYAHEDVDRVRPLVNVLADQGFNVWWDKEIEPGTPFRSVIQEKLVSAACVVVVWTNQSVGKAFVHSEADLANKRGVLVPVLMDSECKIPVGFTEIQYVDLTGWNGNAKIVLRPLIARVRKLVKRSGAWQAYGALIDDPWVIGDSKRAAKELVQVAEKIGALSEILASEGKPTREVAASLDEVHKTYDVVSEAINAFVEPAVSKKPIDAKEYVRFERGQLKRMISEGRGHSDQIATYYGRQSGLRDWLENKITPGKLKQADDVFGRLGTADGDLFAGLVHVGDVLTNESRVIVNLLIAGQEKAARTRIVKGRQRLQPLEKELEKGISALERLERKLGFVRGA